MSTSSSPPVPDQQAPTTPPNINGGNSLAAIAAAFATASQNSKNNTNNTSSSTTASQPNQPLFTIEQIELIRRIKNSGITKEQLIMAYDSFDRVEQELGHVYTVPVTFNQQIPQLALQPMMARLMGQNAMGAQAMAAFQVAQETLAQQMQQVSYFILYFPQLEA